MPQFTVTLDLPNRFLSSNVRCHWGKKFRLTAEHRARAAREYRVQTASLDYPCGFIINTLTLNPYWKTKGKHDLSNLCGNLFKAYEDGFADASGQDDSTWKVLPGDHHYDKLRPRLEVTFDFTEL